MLLARPLVGFSTLVGLVFSGNLFGQTYSLTALSGSALNGALQLNISQTPKGGGKSSAPERSLVTDTSTWHITLYQKVGDRLKLSDPVQVTQVTPADDYEATGRLTITTSATFPFVGKPLVIEVGFLGGGALVASSFISKAEEAKKDATVHDSTPSSAGSSSGKTTAGCGGSASSVHQPGTSYLDYCLSGIWIPQVGSHPLYSTNSNFSMAHWLGRDGFIGLKAQESADSSIVLDPNAFASAVFYQKILSNSPPIPHLEGIILNWNLAEVEFDRKKKNTNLGTNVNLVTAPEIALLFNLPWQVGLEIDAGAEAGHNYKNNISPNGFGALFRGLTGAQAAKIFFPKKHLTAMNEIKVISQYQLRLLADDEVITRSIHGKLVAEKGDQARNWVSTEVDFMFTKHFGLTLKHDYGSLPPGFVFIENRATVGLTVQSSQK